MLDRVRVAYLSLITALLIGGLYSFSYSDEVTTLTPTAPTLTSVKIDISPDVRVKAAQEALDQWIKDTNALIQQNHGIVDSNVVQYATEELENMKNARFVISATEGILSRSNLIVFGISLFGSAFFDYLMEKIQSGEAFTNLPSVSAPAGCKTLSYDCPSREGIWTSSTYKCGDLVSYCTISGWEQLYDTNGNPTGECYPELNCGMIDFCQTSLVFNSNYYYPSSGASPVVFIQGQSPESYLPCKGATPAPDNNAIKQSITYIPTETFSSSAPVSISPTTGSLTPVKTDTMEISDPGYSPDGVFSPSLSTPAPDFPMPPGASITFTDNSGNQTQITTGDNGSVNTNTGTNTNTGSDINSGTNTDPNAGTTPSPNTDPNTNPNTPPDTYTPSDGNLDTNINAPVKKDIASLITSAIQSIKSKFSFDSSCASGNCSFSVDVFGKPATIDFCKFGDVFGVIGTMILTFSYFYAFFIVARGD